MTAPPPISMRERLRTDYHWTPRQGHVLDLIAAGKSNPEIAEALDVSLQGAKWHVSEILDKLDAQSREEAADYWRRYNGLAPRFARVFRGVTTAAAIKWTAAATGLTALAAGGIAIAAVAASNGGDDPSPVAEVSATPADDLLDRLRAGEWLLVDVAGVPAVDGVEATLKFTDPGPQAANVVPQPGTGGWAEGQGSCNGFTGATDIAGDEIGMRDIWRTSMLCPAMEQEERYLDALENAERFAFDGDQLLIFAAGYDLPLRFDPRTSASGTSTPPAATPDATSTTVASPPSSGDRVVDAVVTAVLANDWAAFRALFDPVSVPCEDPDGGGMSGQTVLPDCADGVAAGTAVESVFAGGCMAGWIPASTFGGRNDLSPQGQSYSLHSVIDGGPPWGGGIEVPVRAWAMFTSIGVPPGAAWPVLAVGISNEGVVEWIWPECQDDPHAVFQNGSRGFLVPPQD